METILFFNLSLLQLTISGILLIAFIVQLTYILFYIIVFIRIKKSPGNQPQDPVSIVICSKNEGHFLKENLPFFLKQKYPNFEIIVVNDGSDDETETIVSVFQTTYQNLRMTKIPVDEKFFHNKKLAQAIGIKAAKNEKIIFSNAYSKPSNEKWLEGMMSCWEKGVLLGYANLENNEGFKYNLIKYDFLFGSIKSMCFAYLNRPFSGNGNNFGYKKSDFFTNKGFANHSHFEAGYDHLMVFQLGKKVGTSVCLLPDTKMILSKENLFTHWKNTNHQYFRSRKKIPSETTLILDTELLSRIIFFASLFSAIIFTNLYLFISIVFLLRLIILGAFFKLVTRHLKEENLFLSSYVYDIIILFIKLYFFFINLIFRKRKEWK